AYNYSTFALQFYVNGVLQSGSWQGNNVPNNATPVTTTNALSFGAGVTAVAGSGFNVGDVHTPFNGAIDDIRLWNTARSQAAIQASMNARLIGNESGLVGYWTLDEASGNTALDATANASHGTLGGGNSANVPTRIPTGAQTSSASLQFDGFN